VQNLYDERGWARLHAALGVDESSSRSVVGLDCMLPWAWTSQAPGVLCLFIMLLNSLVIEMVYPLSILNLEMVLMVLDIARFVVVHAHATYFFATRWRHHIIMNYKVQSYLGCFYPSRQHDAPVKVKFAVKELTTGSFFCVKFFCDR